MSGKTKNRIFLLCSFAGGIFLLMQEKKMNGARSADIFDFLKGCEYFIGGGAMFGLPVLIFISITEKIQKFMNRSNTENKVK